MDDATLGALCVFEEAGNQPYEGKVAVAIVVLRRTAQKYMSDGTVSGTVLARNQFSWTGWEMVNGKYTKVAFTTEEERARAEDLLRRAQMYTQAWARALRIASDVRDGIYHSTAFDKITPKTVLYVNLSISHPAWALPQNEVVQIGHHTFYHD